MNTKNKIIENIKLHNVMYDMAPIVKKTKFLLKLRKIIENQKQLYKNLIQFASKVVSF